MQRGCDVKHLAIDQDFLTALQQEDVSRIYIADPAHHVDKGFAGIKDMRPDLLASFRPRSLLQLLIRLDPSSGQ